MVDPAPNPTPVARKVRFITLVTYIGFAAVLAVTQAITNNTDAILSFLPPWAAVFVAPLVPAIIAFITGWETKHAPQDLNLAVVKKRQLR